MRLRRACIASPRRGSPRRGVPAAVRRQAREAPQPGAEEEAARGRQADIRIKYIEDCTADFHGDPKTHPPAARGRAASSPARVTPRSQSAQGDRSDAAGGLDQGRDHQVQQRAQEGPVQRRRDAQARARVRPGAAQGLRAGDAQAARRAVGEPEVREARQRERSTRSTTTRAGSRAIARTRWRGGGR